MERQHAGRQQGHGDNAIDDGCRSVTHAATNKAFCAGCQWKFRLVRLVLEWEGPTRNRKTFIRNHFPEMFEGSYGPEVGSVPPGGQNYVK